MSDNYIPAAAANATSVGVPRECPGCGQMRAQFYHRMGDDANPMLCGRCFDDLVFAGKPELRAKAERHRAEVLAWFLSQPELQP